MSSDDLPQPSSGEDRIGAVNTDDLPQPSSGEDKIGAVSAAVDILDSAGAKTGTVELPAALFDVQANIPLIHQVVVAQQAAARQGTHATKTRGQVRGGGRKPYRQKGTGRARQGSIRAPQFAGGGVVHGPVPHGYAQRTPKKMKAAALRGALSDRARFGRVHVVDGLVSGDEPSTKQALSALNRVVESRSVLVVLDRDDVQTWKSLRNLPRVHLLEPGQLNTYDVLCSDDIVFTRTAFDAFVESGRVGTPDAAESDHGASDHSACDHSASDHSEAEEQA